MMGGLGIAAADPRMQPGETWRAWYNRSAGDVQAVFDQMREDVRSGDSTVEEHRGSAFFAPLAAWYAEVLVPPELPPEAPPGPTTLDPVVVEGRVPARADAGAGGILVAVAVVGAVLLFVGGR